MPQAALSPFGGSDECAPWATRWVCLRLGFAPKPGGAAFGEHAATKTGWFSQKDAPPEAMEEPPHLFARSVLKVRLLGVAQNGPHGHVQALASDLSNVEAPVPGDPAGFNWGKPLIAACKPKLWRPCGVQGNHHATWCWKRIFQSAI